MQADRAAGVVVEFDRATGEFTGVLADIEQSATYADGLSGVAPQDIYSENETLAARP